MTPGYAADDLRQLTGRRDFILARLSLVSEAPAAVAFELRVDTAKGHSEDRPPPGVRNRIRPNDDRPPSRDQSLYHHYRWRFERADDPERIRLLCYLAERDYYRRIRSGGKGRRRGGEDTGDRNRRIVAEYEGVSATEAAVFEELSPSQIRAVRKEFGRDPSTGLGAAA